jgi:hypothetical protein
MGIARRCLTHYDKRRGGPPSPRARPHWPVYPVAGCAERADVRRGLAFIVSQAQHFWALASYSSPLRDVLLAPV